jgi:hypothetical protein
VSNKDKYTKKQENICHGEEQNQSAETEVTQVVE